MPILTSNGRYVLFASTADNLLPQTVGTSTSAPVWNVYLRDRLNGTIKLVSVSTNGLSGGDADSSPAGLSDDGRYALFESRAAIFVEGDTNNANDIFLRDVSNSTTLLISAPVSGLISDGASRSAVMTPDGRYVAFTSNASNLVADDTNGIADIFLRHVPAGVTTSVTAHPSPTNSIYRFVGSDMPAITPDGRYVAFFSTTTWSVPMIQDIYVRDLVLGVTHHASSQASNALHAATGGTNAVSFSHAISAEGRYVAYEVMLGRVPWNSTAPPGIVLRYDLQTGLSDVIHTNAPVPPGPSEETRNVVGVKPYLGFR